jgi:hypothetical protein
MRDAGVTENVVRAAGRTGEMQAQAHNHETECQTEPHDRYPVTDLPLVTLSKSYISPYPLSSRILMVR